MEGSIQNGVLTLRVPLYASPRPSSTGKTHLIATGSGYIGAQFNGAPVKVTVSAMVKPEDLKAGGATTTA